MKRNLTVACIGILAAVTTFSALAQTRPSTLVKQRQAVMTLHGKYFYPLRPMAQNKAPFDAAAFARNAVFLDALSKMPWDGFTPATKDEKSGALPEIYSDPTKFKQAQDSYISEVGKFLAATKTGNEQTIKAAYNDLSKSCDSCHDSFRTRQ